MIVWLAGILSAIVAMPVAAEELRDPAMASATVEFNPAACQYAPTPGSVSGAHIVVKSGMRTIGPYDISLDGFENPDGSAGYQPILIQANAGSTLRIDVDNQLAAPDTADSLLSTVNLHTHGLIVSPRPYQASKPCPGDSVYQTIPPQSLRRYRIDIPSKIPTAFFGLGQPGETVAHPSGLFWFHVHVHTVARPQVTSGMAGLLSIGDPMTHLRVDRDAGHGTSQVDEAATTALHTSTDVRYLALRDLQVEVPACAADAPGCDTKAPLPDHPGQKHQTAKNIGADYSPTLCATPPTDKDGKEFPGGEHNPYSPPDSGFCAALSKDTDRVWMFTVNGQLMPDITLQPGRNHLWRIANLSASLSYVLDLVDEQSSARDATEVPLCVISIDGVVTGGGQACGGAAKPATAGSRFTNVGVALKQILLMPASRAEVFISNDNSGQGTKRLVLRTRGLNMGNSSTQSQGDNWPQIDLAHVVMMPATGAAGYVAPPPLSANLVRTGADAAEIKSKQLKSGVKLPTSQAFTFNENEARQNNPGCQFLPSGSRQHRRQIVFDENEVNGQDFQGPAYPPDSGDFALGSRVVSGPIGAGDKNKNTGIGPIPYGTGHAGHTMDMSSIPTGARVCAVLGRGEVWELVNWTTEVHNFHIHQGKFRLAVKGDPGLPDDFNSPVIGEDPAKSPIMAYLSRDADPHQDVQAWHDTLPVPPRIQTGDQKFVPGRVFVFIPFVAQEQVGSFVFHCHILEHEDRGMMADIQVVALAKKP